MYTYIYIYIWWRNYFWPFRSLVLASSLCRPVPNPAIDCEHKRYYLQKVVAFSACRKLKAHFFLRR